MKLEPLEAGKRVFDAIKQHADEQNWPSFTYNMVDEPLSRDNTKACLGNIKFMRAIAPWMKLVGYYGFSLKNDRLGNDELFKALDGSICKFYNPPILDYAKANDKNIYLYSLGRTRYTYGPYLFRHRLNGVKGTYSGTVRSFMVTTLIWMVANRMMVWTFIVVKGSAPPWT